LSSFCSGAHNVLLGFLFSSSRDKRIRIITNEL
jgi:hypothetical protein